MTVVVEGKTEPLCQWNVFSSVPRVMPFGDPLIDIVVGSGSIVVHVWTIIWIVSFALSTVFCYGLQTDFPCPVFAALPLVLVAQKTGKFFLGDFVYTAFPAGRVVPTLWCYLRVVFGLYSVLSISAIFFNATSSNSNVSPYSVFNTFSMRRYAPYLKSVSA